MKGQFNNGESGQQPSAPPIAECSTDTQVITSTMTQTSVTLQAPPPIYPEVGGITSQGPPPVGNIPPPPYSEIAPPTPQQQFQQPQILPSGGQPYNPNLKPIGPAVGTIPVFPQHQQLSYPHYNSVGGGATPIPAISVPPAINLTTTVHTTSANVAPLGNCIHCLHGQVRNEADICCFFFLIFMTVITFPFGLLFLFCLPCIYRKRCIRCRRLQS